MSIKVHNHSSSTSSSQKAQTEPLYFDTQKQLLKMPSSQDSQLREANGNKLALLIVGLNEIFSQKHAMFSSFCSNQKKDFSLDLSTGIMNQELNDVRQAANKVLNNIFESKDITYLPTDAINWKSDRVSISTMFEKAEQALSDARGIGAEKLGCKIIDKNFQLTYIDRKGGERCVADSSHVECLIYTLYRLKEEKAVETIFHKKGLFPNRSFQAQFDFITKSLGYSVVDTPKRGDWIVYVKDGLLCHAGVMIDEKTVHSQWGTSNKEIIEHPIEAAFALYGKEYYLFRKEPSLLDQPWIL